MDATTKQLAIQGLWATAMWGPGIAAIIVTLFVAKKPFSSLRLNTLGPKRFYLWAWLLPIPLTIFGGLLTVLFGMAVLDLEFTMMRSAMESAAGGGAIPVGLIVLVQIAFAFTLGPLINVVFALGEELGWRGYLLPQLLPLGQWKAMVVSGAIWGVWHAPAILQGHNYPGYPVLGVFMMIIFCVLLGIIISWMYLNTKSPWAAALAHGSVNAVAGLPVLFLVPGFNMAFGGTLAAPTAWIGMLLFITWLVWTKRLPVQDQVGETEAAVPEGEAQTK
ncbi:MAG: CPBP family intramembrane metalloprotease [Anaerolineales bacterium]|nr:MAG: CPBP family intramembrane metalloprotease [Anaerolineales bacterium]